VLDCRQPAAHHPLQLAVEHGRGIGHAPVAAQVERVAQQRDRPVLQRDRPAEQARRWRAASSSSPMATRRPVDTSSRGNHTNANRWRPSALRISTSLGRGRSVTDIAVRAICSSAAAGEGGGQVVRQPAQRMRQRLAGMAARVEAELALERWRCATRRIGTSSGVECSAALVHSPAWTDRPVTLRPIAQRHEHQVERGTAMYGRDRNWT
jgi:hypothetical protein